MLRKESNKQRIKAQKLKFQGEDFSLKAEVLRRRFWFGNGSSKEWGISWEGVPEGKESSQDNKGQLILPSSEGRYEDFSDEGF